MHLRIFFLLCGVIINYDVYAGSNTSNMQVNATVTNNCTISTAALNFNSFASGSAATGSTSISVTCTASAAYRVTLGPGTAPGATTSTRKMTSGSNTLSYGLYQDSNHQTNWGNAASSDDVGGTGSGAAQSLTVYGLVPANYTSPAGVYTDTVAAIVNF